MTAQTPSRASKIVRLVILCVLTYSLGAAYRDAGRGHWEPMWQTMGALMIFVLCEILDALHRLVSISAGAAGAVGTGTKAAREDHVHAHAGGCR